ncbi:unnamed protein product [Leuciscus chuanchicus]
MTIVDLLDAGLTGNISRSTEPSSGRNEPILSRIVLVRSCTPSCLNVVLDSGEFSLLDLTGIKAMLTKQSRDRESETTAECWPGSCVGSSSCYISVSRVCVWARLTRQRYRLKREHETQITAFLHTARKRQRDGERPQK